MIISDQPNCFPETVRVAVSSRADGTMLDRTRDTHALDVMQNRQKFCQANGCSYANCVYQLIRYGDSESYQNIVEVTAGDTTTKKPAIHADALFTTEAGVGLFLPVADCVATVLYDPVKKYLAMAHLGRHSTYAKLATATVEYFVKHGSRASDLIIWMSPSAGKDSYQLEWFDKAGDPEWQEYCTQKDDGYYIDMKEYNRAQFVKAGVLPGSIHLSPIDTMLSPDYFSHSSGDTTGRFAVIAMMTD